MPLKDPMDILKQAPRPMYNAGIKIPEVKTPDVHIVVKEVTEAKYHDPAEVTEYTNIDPLTGRPYSRNIVYPETPIPPVTDLKPFGSPVNTIKRSLDMVQKFV